MAGMDTALILIPDFLLILFGFALRRSGWLAPAFWGEAEKFVYFVLFPPLLFRALARAQLDLAASLPMLAADKEQLIQVVLNIGKNAVQAMQGHGELVFRTRVARQVTLARKRHNLALKLQIIDNGPGIPEEIRNHVFYPLVTGRAEGTGLGLTLAQTFVHQHGGTIEFESRPGHTCFTVLMPFGPDQ